MARRRSGPYLPHARRRADLRPPPLPLHSCRIAGLYRRERRARGTRVHHRHHHRFACHRARSEQGAGLV